MPTDSTFIPLTGGCACGKLRFRMESAPIITHACHCRTCQRVSGSAFRVNTMIESDRLTLLEGEPETVEAAGMHKALQCPACRLSVWTFHPHLGEGIAFVGVGRLDEGERLTPEAHYFTRSKHPWVTLPPEIPAFDERGDPGKSSARERILAVLAKAGSHPGMEGYARGSKVD